MAPPTIRSIALSVILLTAGLVERAKGQQQLLDPAFFARIEGLNTIPDHGGSAVSFLDYRRDAYTIMAVDVPEAVEQEVARLFYAEPVVSTFGQRVAWVGYSPSGPADVFVHDRSSGETTRITSDDAFQNHADLSSEVLVWQDYRDAGGDGLNADVYMHTFASGRTEPITTHPGYQDLPKGHGDWVVWQDYRHAGTNLDTADIYAFRLSTRREHRVTEGSHYRTHPAVWNGHVVWEDYRNGANGDVFLYDISAATEIPITTHPAHQARPTMYGEWVVWVDYRNGTEQGDLYGYHLGLQEEFALVVHPDHQDAPEVYGDHIVWQDYRNSRFDLYSARLPDPTSTAIAPRGPETGDLLTASPNPFHGSITFGTSCVAAAHRKLAIFNALGREVARREIAAGDCSISWDGMSDGGWSVPAGVYIAVVTGESSVQQIAFVRYH